MEKDTTKRRVSISPHAMIKTRNSITDMGFPGSIHRRGLDSWNIKIAQKNIQFIFVFVSLLSFNLPVEIVLVLVFFLFHWSLHVPIPMFDLLENLT